VRSNARARGREPPRPARRLRLRGIRSSSSIPRGAGNVDPSESARGTYRAESYGTIEMRKKKARRVLEERSRRRRVVM